MKASVKDFNRLVYQLLCVFVLAFGLLFCVVANAHGGGGGGGYHGGGGYRGGDGFHGGDNNYRDNNVNGYYNRGGVYGSGWVSPGVVVGVPNGGYTDSCSTIQQCDGYDNCTQTQICN